MGIKKYKTIKITVLIVLMMAMPAIGSEENVLDLNVMAVQMEKDTTFTLKQKTSVSNSCTAYFKGTLSANDCRAGEVPLPAATWLFLLALAAFVGLSNKKSIK